MDTYTPPRWTKTGLTDAYDFTLSFSAIGILQNSANRR
jgi:hypothetical protein